MSAWGMVTGTEESEVKSTRTIRKGFMKESVVEIRIKK